MKRPIRNLFFLFFLTFFICYCTEEQSSESEKNLIPIDSLFESFYQEYLKMDPIKATAIGDKRYNDTLINYISNSYKDSLISFYAKYEERIKKYDLKALTHEQKINTEVLRLYCLIRKEGLQMDNPMIKTPYYGDITFQFLPINHSISFHLDFMGWAGGNGIHPFNTVKDYEDWLNRLEDFIIYFDSVTDNFKKGIELKIVHPKFVTEKMIAQLDEQINIPVHDQLFLKPTKHFPESFSKEEKDRLVDSYTLFVQDQLIPKFKDLREFLEGSYLPASRETCGIGHLPGGEEIYNYLIKYYTTTEMTADEIFEIGKREVKRITAEMEKVKEQVSFEGTLQSFFKYVRSNPNLMPYTDKDQIIDNFYTINERVEANLTKLFLKIPKAELEVRPYESILEGASAQYIQAATDGSRPGIFYVPIADPKKYNILIDESLFLHEGVPGHHFQLSMQQENTEIPKFRNMIFCGTYGEGWALYAESLGKKLGLFTDPYQYLGKLSQEMHRAIRLVVDVGIHNKGWTREQAVQYSLDHEPQSEDLINSEIDRYIVFPGQALSYKIGHLKILELRKYAENELEDKYDIREFHDEILSLGNVPLTILEERIHEWVSSYNN